MKNTYKVTPLPEKPNTAIKYTGDNLQDVIEFINSVGKGACIDDYLSTKEEPVLVLDTGQLVTLHKNHVYIQTPTDVDTVSEKYLYDNYTVEIYPVISSKELATLKQAVIEAYRWLLKNHDFNQPTLSAIADYLNTLGCTPHKIMYYGLTLDICRSTPLEEKYRPHFISTFRKEDRTTSHKRILKRWGQYLVLSAIKNLESGLFDLGVDNIHGSYIELYVYEVTQDKVKV